eukprot:gnl/TRDRNA2_/TRDRNA2_81738_c0_seq1.p1 gnl/TRDRNA2_/TRDRNA2_81738_c0~~gnl/TRDRNA2_/TRDRNA2_81738_c0_seq1.p1  ORF type:complete len:289 (+),score=50.00 gnl/TRDRNA2_/TRDRNA2_81738_c0_seq1:81-869(+)
MSGGNPNYGNQEAQPMMQEQGFAGGPGGAPPGGVPKNKSASIMTLVWFAAALCIIVAGLFGAIILLFEFELLDFIAQMYILLFGIILAVLDTPVMLNHPIVAEVQLGVSRQFNLLTRVTGKGVTYLFVGSLIWASWLNNMVEGFTIFIAVVIGLVVCAVGIFSTMVGLKKSNDINLVRMHFKKDGPQMVNQAIEANYARYAKSSRYGLLAPEFGKMVFDIKGAPIEVADTQIVYNALSSAPTKEFLSQEDLVNWANGNFVLL